MKAAIKVFFTLLILSDMCLSCQTKKESPILQMRWQLLENDVEPGIVEEEITLKNVSNDTLFDNWQMYYNQMSVSPVYDSLSPIVITQIQASYHSLSPTALYQPLAPQDSLVVRVRHRGAIMRRSGGPQGAFLVLSPKTKIESQKHQNSIITKVPIEIAPTTDGHEYRRKVRTFPYADGEWMWQQNERFKVESQKSKFESQKQHNLQPLHLLPQPKEVAFLEQEKKMQWAKMTTLTEQDTLLHAEGYRITIQNDSIKIDYADRSGLFYANATLSQLQEQYTEPLALSILDYPDITHRGFMLDICRNFTPKEEILRLIDLLAHYKMNVLHMHLTDDEGWRIEIPGLEELTEVGSHRGYTQDERDCLYPMYCGGYDAQDKNSSANGYLTRKDYIDILRYADERCIRVIPEIDMPGHSRAAIKAMEARYYKYIDTDQEKAEEYLLSDFQDTSKYVSAQHYTDNVICIALPSCYTFLKKVIDEVVSMYEEAQAPLHIFHVGGDEVPRGAWLGSPKVADYVMARRDMEQTTHPQMGVHAGQANIVTQVDVQNLKDSFLEAIISILDEYGLQIAGWEEIAYRGGQPNPRFANRNALTYAWNSVPEWRGDEKPYILANAGYPVMICCVSNLYLDMCYLNHEEEQGLNWGGYVDEYQSFLLRPRDLYRSVERTMLGLPRDLNAYAQSDKTRLIPDSAKNIYGVQAQLWAETIRNTKQLERYLFPKLLGVAERTWNADFCFEEKETLLNQYNCQLWNTEIPWLHKQGIAFHLTQPGIHIDDEGMGSMNCPAMVNEKCVIRYTTDGSVPTATSKVYTEPFFVPADCHVLNAKAFLLGEESNTTHQTN